MDHFYTSLPRISAKVYEQSKPTFFMKARAHYHCDTTDNHWMVRMRVHLETYTHIYFYIYLFTVHTNTNVVCIHIYMYMYIYTCMHSLPYYHVNKPNVKQYPIVDILTSHFIFNKTVTTPGLF